MMMNFFVLFLTLTTSVFSFVPSRVQRSTKMELAMKSQEFQKVMAAGMIGASLFFGGMNVKAEIDYDGIKYLGGGDKIDLNNANIRAYLKVPGFYPNLASKLVTSGPFKSVGDIYNIPGLSSTEKDTLKKEEGRFVVLDVKPEYELDKVNNGLYR